MTRLKTQFWSIFWKSGLALSTGLGLILLAFGIWRAPSRPYLDFFTFLRAGERAVAGERIYVFDAVPASDGGTANMISLQHPALALLFGPLNQLPPTVAYALWVVVSILAWAVAVFLTIRAAAPPSSWHLPLALLAIAAPGLHWDLQWGQVTCVLSLGVVIGWLLLRRERWLAAGIAVGAVAIMKPFLLPLAFPIVVRGHTRGLIGVGIGVSVPTLLAMPWTGWRATFEWIAALRGVYWLGVGGNISVQGHLTRWLGAMPPSWVVGLLSVLVIVVGLGLLLPRCELPDAERWYGGLIALGILGSPLGWGNYTLFLLPLWGFLIATPLGKGRRSLAIAATILLWLPWYILPDFIGRWLDVMRTLGLVLLVATVMAAPPSFEGALQRLLSRPSKQAA